MEFNIMNVVIDLILVAIFVIFVIMGIKKGFVGAVAKPVKLFTSIGVAWVVCKSVSEKFIYSMVEAPITGRLTSILIKDYSHVTSSTADELPTLIKMAAGIVGVDLTAVSGEGGYIDAVIDAVAAPLVNIASIIISFFISFIVLMLVLSVVFWVINMLIDNGVVGIANKVLGCVFTSVFGLIVIWIVTGLVSVLFGLSALADKEWVMSFDGGFIYNFFRSISPIDLLLSF